jgi:hypothetical protein
LIGRFVPTLQSRFLVVGQREPVCGFVHGHDQLSVDRGKGGTGDITTPESATDDYAESIWVDVPDVGGGFNDAASDEAGPLPDQLGRGEGVGEDVVIQTRDTAEPINRDGADFIIEKVSSGRVLNKSSYSLSLSGLTPTGTGAEHLDDGVGSNGAKAVCDGTGRKLLDSLSDFLHPNHIIFLCRDADVTVLVQNLVDGDEVLVPIMTARMQNVSPMWCVTVKTVPYPILS